MKSIRNSDPFLLGDASRKRNYVVKSSVRHRWSEVDPGEAATGDKQYALSGTLALGALNFWTIVVIIGLSLLIGRTAYLQIGMGDHYTKIAEGNRIRIRDLKAPRGVMYDRNNVLLVENVGSYELAVVPVDLDDDPEKRQRLIGELSSISGKSAIDIEAEINKQTAYSYQPVAVAENLSQEQAIRARILSSTYNGVVLQARSLRNYIHTPETNSLSHVLGYEGKIEEKRLQEYLDKGYSFDDRVGKSGIELMYENELKGKNGKEQVEVEASGLAKEVIASDKPRDGQNLVLSIDYELQKNAELFLKKTLEQFNKERGAVVVLDPRNGEVLALVSYPSFDNNWFARGVSTEQYQTLTTDENRPLFNRVVSGEYPSGSTFKMIVAAAALQEKIVTASTGFTSVGGLSLGAWFFPDWKAGGHGYTNVVKAIAESVNTFFYYVGGGYGDFRGLGPEKIAEYALKFHLSKPLGIDIPNEGDGFIPTPQWKEETKGEIWYIGDTYNISIGQGDVLVTPLQVAGWTSVFANGGRLYRPHVVKTILDSSNNVIKQIEPEVLADNIISNENMQIIREGMRQGVLNGSGARLSALPVTAASKTGTAQWSSTKAPHGWMTAFAPFEQSEIVVTVLIEEGEEGSRTASPVVYDILKWWAENRYLKQVGPQQQINNDISE